MKYIDLSQPQHSRTGRLLEGLNHFVFDLIDEKYRMCRIADGGLTRLKLVWYPDLIDDMTVCLDLFKEYFKPDKMGIFYLYKRYILTSLVDKKNSIFLAEEINNIVLDEITL